MYSTGGIEKLQEINYGTNKSELESYKILIEESFNKEPAHSIKEAQQRIEKLTGLKRSHTQIRVFFRKIGMRFRKMGYVPSKADPEKQMDFFKKKIEPLIELAKKGLIAFYFVDAAHFVHAPYLASVWSFARIFIKSSAGRKRFNVLGALNAISKELITITNDSYINSESIKDLLYKLRETYSIDFPIHLILDNAKYQHCEFVENIAKQLNIHLEFLPTYSPNLNLIERLWKFMKKKVLYGKYYELFPSFIAGITSCVDKINNSKEYNEELNSLLTFKFQLFKFI
jgi:transposase